MENQDTAPEKNRPRRIIFGIIIVGIFAWYFFGRKSEAPNPPITQEPWANYDSGQKLADLDVDAIQQAFKAAQGPQDFERRVNEIYTGKEIISINVQDRGNQNQVVTLYIDKDPKNGTLDTEERILSLNRTIQHSSQEVQIQSTGYGPYQGYSQTSPLVYGLVSGLTHYWIMSSLMYNTPLHRINDIETQRQKYRQSPEYKKRAQANAAKKTSRWGKSGKSGSWNRGTQGAEKKTWTRGTRSFSSNRRSFFGK